MRTALAPLGDKIGDSGDVGGGGGRCEIIGFISIDCGIPEGSNYTDAITGIQYISDKGFIDTGLSRTISPEFKVDEFLVQQLLTLRIFPQGTRNCYNLRPAKGKGNRYLIRARFFYGNYDRKNQLPQFDMHVGADYWDTITFDGPLSIMRYEIIHIPTSDYINICFINTGYGTPFVSSLELRSLSDTIYVTKSGSLGYFLRWDLGSTTDRYVRYAYFFICQCLSCKKIVKNLHDT
ncbi:hypothetical protein LguiA_007160 [Lonicera macranthoides]